MTMKHVGIKKAIQLFGGTEIEVHKNWHEQLGFFVKGGQLYYFNTGDDRMLDSTGQLRVMYRTAQHRKDWTGGTNLWDFVGTLNRMGYRVDKFPASREAM